MAIVNKNGNTYFVKAVANVGTTPTRSVSLLWPHIIFFHHGVYRFCFPILDGL
jgi:hypothetical protein